ncbi:MAG: DNA polymerase [Methylophilaceae bacterium]|jgi:DNA polymerase-4|nr:DNA polymerase [Methylophilaceae bacterium]
MSLNALYVDFNSYFASVEQQIVPELRGKPVGVLPVMAETTCCIAASYEAKAFGINTGTIVRDARKLCKDIIFVKARPPLYVELHHKLIAIVESCTPVEEVRSIDEMVCKLTGSQQNTENALKLAAKIKREINKQYPYIKCSIGIAPNIFLSKVASNMQKPDGCIVIEQHEVPEKLFPLKLCDLNGIGRQMEARLNRYKITTVQDIYKVNKGQLRIAWGSVEGGRMYDKLRGLEPHYVKNTRNSLGHSHVLPPAQRNIAGAKAVLHRLLQKTAMRMRSYELLVSNVKVKVKFRDHPSFNADSHISPTDDTITLTSALETLWKQYPTHQDPPVAIGVNFSGLVHAQAVTKDLFSEKPSAEQQNLNAALDKLNLKYGKNTVYLGGAHEALKDAPMRIAFNHIPSLVIENDD